MSKEPKIRYVKPDPLKDPWKKLREKPGVTIKSTARRVREVDESARPR